MPTPFCGTGKTPKGKTVGTMKGCAEIGQVRRYGVVKIDKRTLESAKKKETIKEGRDELIKQVSAAKGSQKRLARFIDGFENKLKRKPLTDIDKLKLKESKDELVKVNKVFNSAAAKLRVILAADEKANAKPAVKKIKKAMNLSGDQAAKKIPLKTRKRIIDKAAKKIGAKRKAPLKSKTVKSVAAKRKAKK